MNLFIGDFRRANVLLSGTGPDLSSHSALAELSPLSSAGNHVSSVQYDRTNTSPSFHMLGRPAFLNSTEHGSITGWGSLVSLQINMVPL